MDSSTAFKTKYSSQEIDNMSFDPLYRSKVTEVFDVPKATKVTTAGSATYVGIAPVGSSQSDPVWQAQKIDTTTGAVVTWADNGNFSQVATDLTALTYS